jgi:hypothetical protein
MEGNEMDFSAFSIINGIPASEGTAGHGIGVFFSLLHLDLGG